MPINQLRLCFSYVLFTAGCTQVGVVPNKNRDSLPPLSLHMTRLSSLLSALAAPLALQALSLGSGDVISTHSNKSNTTKAFVVKSAFAFAGSNIVVTSTVPGRQNCTLSFKGKTHQCALGKNGVSEAGAKREGDGCTPSGSFPLRRAFYRSDKRGRPSVPEWFSLKETQQDFGWCDAEGALYNEFTTFPLHPAQCGDAEHLWLNGTDVYDYVGVIGYNDNPPVPGMGSAIFFHLAHPGWAGTAGCVTVEPEVWEEVMEGLTTETWMVIS